MSMTTTPAALVLDANVIEPLIVESLVFGDCAVRQPDFVDFVSCTAAWIGENASVEVSFDSLARVAELARTWCPTSRPAPEALGVTVALHDPNHVHPAFASHTADKARRFTLWAEFSEVLTNA